jgi:hypothetical protein
VNTELDALVARARNWSDVEKCLNLYVMLGKPAFDLMLVIALLGRVMGTSPQDHRGDYLLLLAILERHEPIERLVGVHIGPLSELLVPLVHSTASYRMDRTGRPEPLSSHRVEHSWCVNYCYWVFHDVTGVSLGMIDDWLDAAMIDALSGGELGHRDLLSFAADCGAFLSDNIRRWRNDPQYKKLVSALLPHCDGVLKELSN